MSGHKRWLGGLASAVLMITLAGCGFWSTPSSRPPENKPAEPAPEKDRDKDKDHNQPKPPKRDVG